MKFLIALFAGLYGGLAVLISAVTPLLLTSPIVQASALLFAGLLLVSYLDGGLELS